MRQPGPAELVQFIVSGDWAEDNLWKWRRDGRFAGKANAQAHGDEMHQGVAANIELLHTKFRVMIAVGQPFCEPVTERGIALALAHDEVLVAKIRPLDFVPSAQRVILRENNENPFVPKGDGIATLGFGLIHDKRHIKLSLQNGGDVVG